jgi:hypothetical protein
MTIKLWDNRSRVETFCSKMWIDFAKESLLKISKLFLMREKNDEQILALESAV